MFRQATIYFTGCLIFIGSMASPGLTADFSGECCQELEERLIELEETTVRKGNRKISLTVSGHVNHGLLFWDDGSERDVYVVGNANDDPTLFGFEGEVEIDSQWSAGLSIELEVTNAISADLNQQDDNGDTGDIETAASYIWVANSSLGMLTWGFADQPSDGAPEVDLSGTVLAGYASVSDVAGGFFVRRSDQPGAGGLIESLTLEDLMDDLNGDAFNIVRYDTPEFAGFTLSASWGEDDIWDVALAYAGEFASLQVEGIVAYVENSDEDDGELEVDNKTVIGSLSALHEPTGLNLTFAAGRREFDHQFIDNRGILSKRNDDQVFYYVKAGWIRNRSSLGDTAIYGEYGHYQGFFSNDADEDQVQALNINNEAACAGVAIGCLGAGSDARIWGFGVVQYIDSADLQIYAGYRYHDMNIDLADLGGASVPSASLESFETVLAGALLEF